jgi:predicted Zn-dependent peptidase
MTRTIRILCCLLAALAVAATAAAQPGTLKLPAYKKVVLRNGMTVLLMEQREVPLVSFSVLMKAGSVLDPAGKEGVASMTAALLRKGTATRSADDFSAQLDFIGGSFGAGATADATSISAEFMKKDLAKGLELLADAMLHPTFPEAEVKKLAAQRVDGIKSAKDRAAGVISQYYNAYLYGKHPYARPTGGDESSLASIAREDVSKFYEANYAPGGTVMAVAGDFSTAEMEKQLAAVFGGWPVKPAAAVALTDAPPVKGRKLLLVDKPDSTQTYFRIGNIGIARSNPDRVLIEIVNTLFGGRFTSMINTELRIKSGLTYGASSAFVQSKAKGPFFVNSYTSNANTEKALDMTLDVLKRLQDKGISDDDLKSAKAYLKGQFPPEIETADQLAATLADLVFNGLDEREINTYYAKVDGATTADVNRVIKQYFPLEDLVFVLVGKASEIEGLAKKYAATVDRKSISAAGF